MKAMYTLFKTEVKLSIREFSGVLFGILLPAGIMTLLGIIYGSKPAFTGAEYSLVQQAFPAVAAIGICATGLMGIPLSIASSREKKVLKRFKVTPTSPAVLLGAQVLCNLVFALISFLFVFVIAFLFFNYRLRGSVLYFAGAYLIVLFCIYSFGLMIASVSKTMKIANLLTTVFYFPMFFLSGATIPYEIMPTGLQKFSNIMPLTQGIKLLKGVSLNLSDYNYSNQVIILIGLAVICTIISIKAFRWE